MGPGQSLRTFIEGDYLPQRISHNNFVFDQANNSQEKTSAYMLQLKLGENNLMRKSLMFFFASIGFTTCLFIVLGSILGFILFRKVAYFSHDEKSKGEPNIGVVEVKGEIVESEPTVKRIKELLEEEKIKGILVRIDSPGGAVGPSQEIYQTIFENRAKKKFVASIETAGASGAYYIASATNKIVANQGSLTGSIGVIMEFMNLQGIMNWAKVEQYNVKSGALKDLGSPNRAMTPEERKYVQGLVESVNEQFIGAISEGRAMPAEEIRPVADGRIMTGKQAFDAKLIDELGNMDDAVKLLQQIAGIKEQPILDLPSKKKPEILEYLTESVYDHVAKMMTPKSRLMLRAPGL